ncbi:MAG: hypothetical protein C0508_31680, partial [Cyanobacteria bacterium PR.023]|nr:hypothetical protein [Cyanobacteria bacterium PR.023]
MRCPNCGTYHPSQYQNCVSCGQEFYVEEEIVETAPLSDSANADDARGAVSPHNSQSNRNYADPDYIPPASEPFAQVRYDVSRKDSGDDLFDESGERPAPKSAGKAATKRRSSNMSLNLKSGMPLTGGVLFGLTTVLIFAGATIFFLTKAPEE